MGTMQCAPPLPPPMNSPQELLRELHRRSVWQVVGLYLATSWGVLNAVDVLTGFAGLPDWTPTMALVLLLIGFPIVTATAVIQKGMPGGGSDASSEALLSPGEVEVEGGASEEHLDDRPTGSPEPDEGIRALFTWRNALLGGGAAVALLLLSGGAYLAMWALGVGPVGSLVAQGVLDSRDPVLLVNFDDRTGGEELGVVVAQALAVDLGASPVVTLLGEDAVTNAVRLMGRDPSEPVTSDFAREVALRANIKAYIEGDVTRVGSRYLIVSRIVSPQSGEDLVSFREEAASDDDLLPAIDRLSQSLREKLGESLRDIRLDAPLEEVTTSSFEALRKLTQAEWAEEDGDYALAERLLREAIALDPEFAMAHRKMAVILFNAGRPRELIIEASTLVYQYRARLTDRERYLTEANYHSNVTGDALAALEAFDAILEIHPDDAAALNNSSNILRSRTRLEEAQARLERAVSGGGGASSVAFWNFSRTRFLLADSSGALESIAEYRDRYPGHIYQPFADLMETMAVGETAGIEGRIRAIEEVPALQSLSRRAALWRVAAQIEHGRLGRELEAADEIDVIRRNGYHGFIPLATGLSDVRFWLFDDSVGSARALEATLGGRFDDAPVDARPWGEAVALLALSSREGRATELLTRWEAELPEPRAPRISSHQAVARAMIDAGADRLPAALEQIDAAVRDMSCPRCFEMQRAIVLERMGRFGEAITIWETVRDYPIMILEPGFERAVARRRLGPLHEANGDTTSAIAAYQEFANAWTDADVTLQPQVAEARAQIAALGG